MKTIQFNTEVRRTRGNNEYCLSLIAGRDRFLVSPAQPSFIDLDALGGGGNFQSSVDIPRCFVMITIAF